MKISVHHVCLILFPTKASWLQFVFSVLLVTYLIRQHFYPKILPKTNCVETSKDQLESHTRIEEGLVQLNPLNMQYQKPLTTASIHAC